MSEKERLTAIGIGCIVAFFVLFGGYRMVSGGFKAKNDLLSEQQAKLQQKKGDLNRAKRDQMVVGEYKRKSLHHEPRTAHLDFQHWLEIQLEESELDEHRVGFDTIPRTRKTMKQLSYQVTGVGNINQITSFLHRVHSADTLHRVRTVNMQKKKDGGINFTARIDALSLPEIAVPKGGKKVEKVAIGTINEAKVPTSLEEYQDAIASRNLFSPANLPPKFRGSKTEKVELGSKLNASLKATDPEDAGVFFELDDGAPAWMEITKSGKLSGRPKELGEFDFKLYVVDKGIPSKETIVNMTVEVVEKKVEEKEPEKPREEFDASKTAKLTAIVQGVRDPMPQMCMYLQDKDESQFLQEGDDIKIGKWRGNVVAVYPESNSVLLQNEDGDYELRLGEMLSEARLLDEDDDSDEAG